jgi:hypothetical protein
MTRCHEIDSDCRALFFHLNQNKELVMKGLIGAAVVASAFVFAGPAAINPALAAAPQVKAQTAGVSDATDFSARRYYRHHYRHGYRPYYRPSYYYRPYPYSTPAPFTFGFGFGPFW